MDKKDASIFLLAVLTVVFIYKIETKTKDSNLEFFNRPIFETSYGISLAELDSSAKTYEEALALAKDSGKPVFIYFQADWCGYCAQMKKNVFSNNQVKKMLSENFIKIFIDVDEDKATKSLFKIKSLPTYLVVSPEGDVIQKHSGYMDLNNFLIWLEPKITTTQLMN